MTKRCRKCEQEKELTDYYRSKKHADGLQTACKACMKLLEKAHAAAFASGERHRPTHKKCPRCKRKLLSMFFGKHAGRADGLDVYCKRCKRQYYRGVLRAHRQRNNKKTRDHRVACRMRVLAFYGGTPPSCACCGESHLEFLVMDHIAGGGRQHRKTMKAGSIYVWLEKTMYPSGFRVLCANCNHAWGIYGSCPHGRQMSEQEVLVPESA